MAKQPKTIGQLFADGVTIQESGHERATINGLLERGVLRQKGTRQTGKRGRPALVYVLTAKGKRIYG